MALNWKFKYLLLIFCKIEKNVGSFLSRSTDPHLLGFPLAWGFGCVVHGYVHLQTGMHAWHFENIVGPRPQIQSLTEHGYQPACLRSVTSGLRGTSVTVRGIGVLNKWLKCATETQYLLASTPCWHKCHMITLVTVHDFISIERFDFAHAFWRCRSNGDGSTCNRCACSRFKTPEQPYKASDRQSLVNVTL